MKNTEEVVLAREWKALNRYINVKGDNCYIEIVGNDNDPELIVNDIQDGLSTIYFKTEDRYPLAIENWFQFGMKDPKSSNNKSIYFNNYISIHTRIDKCLSRITFIKAPSNSNTESSSSISATFNILNENGAINDPILTLKW
ncbi:hypothetical protein [Tenacibaculum ovolyticum]|uniref:hypothetical protein n=1 Tax=Tenacibaculum ovolyticum TaxID=104270 RepID=UPI003BA88989